MEIKWEKWLNQKNITILNRIFLIIGILVYEIFYCNSKFVEQVGTYHWSCFRIVIYIILLLFSVMRKKTEEDCFQEKKNFGIILLLGNILVIELIVTTILLKQYSQLIAVIILTVLVTEYGLIHITKSYVKNIILMILCFGFICAIGSPFNHIIDEKRHFLSAYNIAMGNWNYHNPIIHEEFQFMDKAIAVTDFSNYFETEYHNESIEGYQEEDVTNMPATYSQLTYIPAATGIQIAKLCHGLIADMYIAGRMTSCIAYALLMGIALKIIPFKKRLLYIIATMPTIIGLAASYSIDAITMGVVSIFIAYCLELSNQEVIKRGQIIKLMLLFFMVLQLKSMGYIVIGLLIFLLPLKKMWKENKKIILLGMVIMILLQIGSVVISGMFSQGLGGDPRVKGTDTLGQIQYIKSAPFQFGKTMIESLFHYLTNYNVLYRIQERVFFTDRNSYITFLFLLIYIIIASLTDNEKLLTKKEKIIFLIIFFLQILLIMAIMYLTYTPVGADVLQGYHPRYLFPILFLLLSCFSTKKIIWQKKEKNEEISTAIMMGVFMMISIAGMITKI